MDPASLPDLMILLLLRCETGTSGLPAGVSPALLEKPGDGFLRKESFSSIESGIVGEGLSGVTHRGAGFMKRKDLKTDDKSHSCLVIS